MYLCFLTSTTALSWVLEIQMTGSPYRKWDDGWYNQSVFAALVKQLVTFCSSWKEQQEHNNLQTVVHGLLFPWLWYLGWFLQDWEYLIVFTNALHKGSILFFCWNKTSCVYLLFLINLVFSYFSVLRKKENKKTKDKQTIKPANIKSIVIVKPQCYCFSAFVYGIQVLSKCLYNIYIYANHWWCFKMY